MKIKGGVKLSILYGIDEGRCDERLKIRSNESPSTSLRAVSSTLEESKVITDLLQVLVLVH